jgi:prophage regulatory protein
MSQSLERPRDAAKRCGISVSQLYREVKAGRIAPPIKVGERASAFPSEEIDRFIAERIKESRKAQRAGTPAPIPEPQA